MFVKRNLSPEGTEIPHNADATGDGAKLKSDAFDTLPSDNSSDDGSEASKDVQTSETEEGSEDIFNGDEDLFSLEDDPNEDDTSGAEEDEEEAQQQLEEEEISGKKKGEVVESAEEIAAKAAAAEEESDWIKVGKALGIEVEKDDFEEFQAKVKNRLDSKELDLSRYTPGQRRYIEAFNAGLSEEEAFIPTIGYDKTLALDDEQLVRKSLELNGWEKPKIDQKIKILKDEAKLDLEAYELRISVKNARDQFVESELKARTEKKASDAIAAKTAAEAETKSVLEAIDSFEEFEGVKLTKEQKADFKKKWLDGEYRKRFKDDPKFVAKSILSTELSTKAVTKAKTDASKSTAKEVKSELKRKFHNLQDLPSNKGGSKIVPDNNDELSYQEAWGGINENAEK